jgi:hypothetical protein
MFRLMLANISVISRPFLNIWKTTFQVKGARVMPKKKALDTAKLIAMVKEETPSAEIMKKMGFKTSTQLKTAYMSALIAEGKVPAIKGSRGAGKADDKFTVRKTKAGLTLKKAE